MNIEESNINMPAGVNCVTDRTRYYFNGKKYPKNRLVLAVIKDYADRHDIKDVSEKFNTRRERPVIKKFDELSTNDRYFSKDDEIIVSNDGTKYAVDRQWINNSDFSNFLFVASYLGFHIIAETELKLKQEDPQITKQAVGARFDVPAKGVCTICGEDLSKHSVQKVYVHCNKCGKKLMMCPKCQSRYSHICKSGNNGNFVNWFDEQKNAQITDNVQAAGYTTDNVIVDFKPRFSSFGYRGELHLEFYPESESLIYRGWELDDKEIAIFKSFLSEEKNILDFFDDNIAYGVEGNNCIIDDGPYVLSIQYKGKIKTISVGAMKTIPYKHPFDSGCKFDNNQNIKSRRTDDYTKGFNRGYKDTMSFVENFIKKNGRKPNAAEVEQYFKSQLANLNIMRKSSLEPLMEAIKTCIQNHKSSINSFADIETMFSKELMSVKPDAIGRIVYSTPPKEYSTDPASVNGIPYYIHKTKDGWEDHAEEFRDYFNHSGKFTPQDRQILENGLRDSGL